MHYLTPAALGLKASSLEHKLQRVLHCLYLQAPDVQYATPLQTLRVVCANVCSFTTDLGTEVGIADYKTPSLSAVLPPWCHTPSHHGLQSDMGDPEIEQAGELESVWPNALVFPGILHIIDNCLLDVDQHMPMWSKWLEGLKSIMKLLCNKAETERYVETCVKGSAFEHWGHMLLKRRPPSIVNWRWSIVVKTLQALLPMKVFLKSTWSSAKYKGQGQELEGTRQPQRPCQPQSISELSPDLITQTLENSWWWDYGEMLFSVHTTVNQIGVWGERCPCHSWATHVSAKRRYLIQRIHGSAGLDHAGDGLQFQCPMRGCRAPELARGKLQEALGTIADETAASLLLRLDPTTNPDERFAVINDFESAKMFAHAILEQKLDFLKHLPWALMGVAHWSPAEARAAAKVCVELFDRKGADPKLHHRKTWAILGPGLVRDQLELFMNGACMNTLPELASHIQPFAFILVTERSAEKPHSIIHKGTCGRKPGPAYVSMQLRAAQLAHGIHSDARVLDALAVHFDKVRDPRKAAIELRLDRHPEVARICSMACTQTSKRHQVLASAVYTVDLRSKYQTYAAAHQAKLKEDRLKAKISRGAKEKQRLTVNAVIRAAMIDHAKRKLIPGSMYSLPFDCAAPSCLRALPSLLADGRPLPIKKPSPQLAWNVTLGMKSMSSVCYLKCCKLSPAT